MVLYRNYFINFNSEFIIINFKFIIIGFINYIIVIDFKYSITIVITTNSFNFFTIIIHVI